MKLFKNTPRQQGDAFEDSYLTVFGECFKSTCIIERLPDGTALDHDHVSDGWYLLFNLPLTRMRKFLSAVTYEEREGMCRPKLLFRIRKIGKNRHYSMFYSLAWKPVYAEAEIRYDDPYLASIKTIDIINGK
jgi:hypothetical protein